jgi:hypothetical protein
LPGPVLTLATWKRRLLDIIVVVPVLLFVWFIVEHISSDAALREAIDFQERIYESLLTFEPSNLFTRMWAHAEVRYREIDQEEKSAPTPNYPGRTDPRASALVWGAYDALIDFMNETYWVVTLAFVVVLGIVTFYGVLVVYAVSKRSLFFVILSIGPLFLLAYLITSVLCLLFYGLMTGSVYVFGKLLYTAKLLALVAPPLVFLASRLYLENIVTDRLVAFVRRLAGVKAEVVQDREVGGREN